MRADQTKRDSSRQRRRQDGGERKRERERSSFEREREEGRRWQEGYAIQGLLERLTATEMMEEGVLHHKIRQPYAENMLYNIQ